MKKIIVLILLICLLSPTAIKFASSIENILDYRAGGVAHADGNDTTYGNHFLQHYFINLRSNIGRNQIGTCGYVALGMLLSYFDTYWDDDIVPECYETPAIISSVSDLDYDSPGAGEIYHSYNSCGYEGSLYTEEIFYHVMNDHWQDTLQGALLREMMNNYNELNFQQGPDGNTYINSIDPYQAEIIANSFLGSDPLNSTILTSVNYTDLYGIEDEDVLVDHSLSARERIITSVTSNIPVAVYYGSTTDWFDRHVAIAYDYDDANDMLYFHLGYMGGNTHVSEASVGLKPNQNSQYTKYYYGDLTLFTKYSHVHSNNFIIENSEEAICSCQLTDHSHVIRYETYNTSRHKILCHCGYASMGNHAFVLEGTNYVCRYCKHIHIGLNPPITPVRPILSTDIGMLDNWFGADLELEIAEDLSHEE